LKRNKEAVMIFINRKAKQKRGAVPILTKKTNFSATEAYKAARTNLLFTLQAHKNRRVLITSAAPDEGKSTTCCNLGITLAQTDSKVLILDCDLRKPIMHKCFNRECVPGLSELLAGMKDDFSEVVQDTDYPNLKVICGGTVPPNPSELLSSIAMKVLLCTLSIEYDYILLDTPPVNLVADALALSAITDGVVIVVRQGQTTHPELSHALASLKFAKAKVLGIILNGVRSAGSYGYRKYGYKKYPKYFKEHE
jgi:capsular exopolysaccharide synthesis family protein